MDLCAAKTSRMRSPTVVPTTSAVAPSCIVHPSSAAPAFVPSSQLVQVVDPLQLSGEAMEGMKTCIFSDMNVQSCTCTWMIYWISMDFTCRKGIWYNYQCYSMLLVFLLRPSEDEDIEIMGATTPPPSFQAPSGVQKPPEPLKPPSSEAFLSRKPPEPQMPPRYAKEHTLHAQPSTPPKSGLTSCRKWCHSKWM